MAGKSDYSLKKRTKFANALAKALAPEGSGATLTAVNDAIFPGLADLADPMFAIEIIPMVTPQCTAMPTTQELRDAILQAHRRTAPQARQKPALKPITPWILQRVMQACGGQPGPNLSAWLQSHGHSDAEIDDAANASSASFASAKRDWQNPRIVLESATSLDGHPMAGILGRMLHALVERHAPENLGWIPPQYHPDNRS